MRNLVKQELDITIQSGEHSSVRIPLGLNGQQVMLTAFQLQDARATMAVYRIHKKEWEKGAVGASTAMLLRTTAKKHVDTSTEGGDISLKAKGKRKSNLDGEESGSEGFSEDEEEAVTLLRQQDTKKPSKATKIIQASKNASRSHKKGKMYPGGGRKGISSGLSTVVRDGRRVKVGDSRGGGSHRTSKGKSSEGAEQWWKSL